MSLGRVAIQSASYGIEGLSFDDGVVLTRVGDALVNDLADIDRIGEQLVARMTTRAGLKSRTFARRFRSATEYQPMDYVHAIRIEEAKQLLETSDISVEEISHAVGYEDPTSFRRLFKRKGGLTPAAYRRKFVGILASELR